MPKMNFTLVHLDKRPCQTLDRDAGAVTWDLSRVDCLECQAAARGIELIGEFFVLGLGLVLLFLALCL